MSRYGNIEFVFKLSYQDGIDLCTKAKQEKQKDRKYLVWAHLYEHYTKKTFMSFEEFCIESSPKKPEIIGKKKTAKELIEESDAIKRQIEGR
ncbi:MAG: hypothetical protein WC998_06865 [Candidatus Paceibacterota bacterium]